MKVRKAKKREPLIVEVPTVLSRIEGQIAKLDAPPPLRAEPTRVGSAMVEAVPFVGVAPLLTLDDPNAPPEAARGAFARLRPPDDHPPGETASWRSLVAAQAIAARVVPRPRRREALLPAESRPTPAADVRAEATALAAATNDPEVAKLVEEILSEVEKG